MRVLIAPDKFKGSLSAKEVCKAIAGGIQDADNSIQITEVPLADGGEGTSELLTSLANGSKVAARVRDPLGRIIVSEFGLSIDRRDAFLEMSSASGLQLLSASERNPAHTTTVGTGDLIRAALDTGAKQIILGIGGSATNDVGTGMANALGFRFIDSDGNELRPVGKNLSLIKTIDRSGADPRLALTKFIVLCDVANPLFGDNGASTIFGPQKGASRGMVEMLENGVVSFADLVHSKYGFDLNFPGAGAAGGLGAGAKFFLGASIVSGIDFMLDYASVDSLVRDADLVITGEGKADQQTVSGKVVAGMSRISRAYNKPLWVVTGRSELSPDDVAKLGISKCIGLTNNGFSYEESMRNAFQLIRNLVADAFRSYFGRPA